MTDAFTSQLIPQADYVVPVEIEWQWHNVYVIKRPGVDSFLKRMGELYEVVVFTASLSKVNIWVGIAPCVMVTEHGLYLAVCGSRIGQVGRSQGGCSSVVP